MTAPLRLAVAGIGNNISALVQGIEYYKTLGNTSGDDLPGVKNPEVGGLRVTDIDVVAAFDIQPDKIGQELGKAILTPPNNYPRLAVSVDRYTARVQPGIRQENGRTVGEQEVAAALKAANAEVLLYSLPTGLQWAADAYARSALSAGVGLVNCTPETIARNDDFLAQFTAKGLALIGDDLASHLGSSIVHRNILSLLSERGITLQRSYQLNFGGNEDFKNLRQNSESKLSSKKNALAGVKTGAGLVEVIPSAGYVSQLGDRKVAVMNVTGLGWAGTEVTLDLTLKVQDSSNAAGVIIDLIRIAAAIQRAHHPGFSPAAVRLLKSPPRGHQTYAPQDVAAAQRTLQMVALA
jgi:myo-inositol-1-phosphate synthase